MRIFGIAMASAALAGCVAAPAAQSIATSAPQAFVVPMDPGEIGCPSLAIPAAQAEALEWMLGHARAQVVSGQQGQTPDPAQVASSLMGYCGANSGSTIAAAARAMGI